jgi:hypothetical protein
MKILFRWRAFLDFAHNFAGTRFILGQHEELARSIFLEFRSEMYEIYVERKLDNRGGVRRALRPDLCGGVLRTPAFQIRSASVSLVGCRIVCRRQFNGSLNPLIPFFR